MGARGPKPTPAAVLHKRGTFRADRHSDSVQPLGIPKCPKFITDKDAKKEFKRVSKLLLDMGLVGAADENLLVRYCTTWVRWRRVNQTLMSQPNAEYAIHRDEAGKVTSIRVSAMHAVARSLSEELTRAESLLGMSPSARSRLNVSVPTASEENSKASFFTDNPMRIAT